MAKRINPEIEKQIGGRIRAARLLAGLSQEALAAKLAIGNPGGLTFQQVQKYENGINRVSVSRLVEIAQITGQPISFFLPEAAESGDLIGFDRADLALVRRVAGLSPRTKRALETFIAELDLAA